MKRTTEHDISTDNTKQQKNCKRKIVLKISLSMRTASRFVLSDPSSVRKILAGGDLPVHPPGCIPALPHPAQQAR